MYEINNYICNIYARNKVLIIQMSLFQEKITEQ